MTALTWLANIILSCIGGFITYQIIQEYIPIFLQRKLCGWDRCKANNTYIAEPAGVISAAVYLIIMFLFIPFLFYEWNSAGNTFPHEKFLIFLSAIVGICSSILLGFADDILDLRWRHKLLFPTLSSLPLLLVYYTTHSSTTIVVPVSLQKIFAFSDTIDIGILYYVYMGMMIVFCTNAINILAGINGLEAGQALIIAISVALFNFIQYMRIEERALYHSLSIYFLLPFISTNIALIMFNWYPARVFVGDTFCYWAGMTLACTCILGHFSKTMVLFLIPQVFNFVYSTPQLFHLVPCPRHRLPRYMVEADKVDMSVVQFKVEDLRVLAKCILNVLHSFGLLHRRSFEKDGETWQEINNLTLINLALKFSGPLHEERLTIALLGIQTCCSILAFFIRFGVTRMLYDSVA